MPFILHHLGGHTDIEQEIEKLLGEKMKMLRMRMTAQFHVCT